MVRFNGLLCLDGEEVGRLFLSFGYVLLFVSIFKKYLPEIFGFVKYYNFWYHIDYVLYKSNDIVKRNDIFLSSNSVISQILICYMVRSYLLDEASLFSLGRLGKDEKHDSTRVPQASLRVFGIVSLLALFFAVQGNIATTHAQALHNTIAASDTTACVSHPRYTGSYAEYCIAPSMTQYCPGPQCFSATDGYGNPLDWTYTDQNNTCVQIAYHLYSTPNPFWSCQVDFYIPNADSSALFEYYWTDSSGIHSGLFNENPVDGWHTFITSSMTLGSLYFTDHNSPGGVRLGWGSNPAHSVREICG